MKENKIKTLISRFYTVLGITENFILMLLLVIMGLTLGMQVVFRYFLNSPLIWSEELARYLQVTITFLAIGFGLRHDSHISMIIVRDRMSHKTQVVVRIFTNILLVVCFILFFIGAGEFARSQHKILSSAMQIRMSFVYISIPISCVLFILWTLKSIAEEIKHVLGKEADE